MTILDQLSSQLGDRTQESNRRVVAQCLANTEMLAEIAAALTNHDAALAGDCAEVLTQVAEQRPELVAPHAAALAPLLAHKTTRVRWEATHALALVATLAPDVIDSLLPRLGEIIRSDASVIVRDYAVDAVGNYAKSGITAAQPAYPLLKEALTLWNGKQAGHALNGLGNVALSAPGFAAEIQSAARPYLDDGRAVVRKAAKALVKTTQRR